MPFPALRATLQQRPLNVVILLFPEVEVLDFAGPFEVFGVAARLAPRLSGLAHPAFALHTVAAQSPLRARHGLEVQASACLEQTPAPDLLIVPGGVIDQPLRDPRTLAWIATQAERSALLASVCTGAFLLAECGLLDGLQATTHWEDLAELRQRYPRVEVREDVPFVAQGRMFTSAGISAGIGLSLHLVAGLLGREMALATARQMHYDWH